MLLTRLKGSWKVIAETYSLTFVHDRPFVYVQDARGKRLADLFVLSGVHPLHDREDTIELGTWETQQSPQGIVLALVAGSSVWQRKTYRFRCSPNRFSYEIEVEGSGDLSRRDSLPQCDMHQRVTHTPFVPDPHVLVEPSGQPRDDCLQIGPRLIHHGQ